MDTIFALSSGALPSGVAVIRLSGPASLGALRKLSGVDTQPRKATLCRLTSGDGLVLDEVLALSFPAPASFTGEDCVELHCHGGRATVDAVLGELLSHGLRPADAGEFSRRAFANGKMDLTQAEGLGDLLAAQTEVQRRAALDQLGGNLRALVEGWRDEIVRVRAFFEASVDFSDEGDVPDEASDELWTRIEIIRDAMETQLAEGTGGEIIRSGFRIALVGPPNAGKSSLLNALAKRDVAIVDDEAGTTRDVLEVELDLDGHLVRIFDTAGLRETDNRVEREGIRRAHAAAENAELVLWLQPTGALDRIESDIPENAISVVTKDDGGTESALSTSVVAEGGLDQLLSIISTIIEERTGDLGSGSLTRVRHRHSVAAASSELSLASGVSLDDELRWEHLRRAGDELGRITGRIDVEDLLDVIFSEFCVGK